MPHSVFGSAAGGSAPEATWIERLLIRAGSTYPWLYPTPDFQNFDKFGAVALPAAAASAPMLASVAGNTLPFTVPKGFNGFIKAIAIEYVPNGGAAFTPGVIPQQLAFTLSINGVPAPDYGNLAYSPGAIQSPTPVAGIPIKEGNVVLVTVKNLTLVATTQFVMARLQGYYYGKQFEPKNLAF